MYVKTVETNLVSKDFNVCQKRWNWPHGKGSSGFTQRNNFLISLKTALIPRFQKLCIAYQFQHILKRQFRPEFNVCQKRWTDLVSTYFEKCWNGPDFDVFEKSWNLLHFNVYRKRWNRPHFKVYQKRWNRPVFNAFKNRWNLPHFNVYRKRSNGPVFILF